MRRWATWLQKFETHVWNLGTRCELCAFECSKLGKRQYMFPFLWNGNIYHLPPCFLSQMHVMASKPAEAIMLPQGDHWTRQQDDRESERENVVAILVSTSPHLILLSWCAHQRVPSCIPTFLPHGPTLGCSQPPKSRIKPHYSSLRA